MPLPLPLLLLLLLLLIDLLKTLDQPWCQHLQTDVQLVFGKA